MSKSLYSKISEKGFKPGHVCEVGVYKPETLLINDFIDGKTRCTLVEPDPESAQLIKDFIKGNNKITLHEVAVLDKKGKIELTKREASTFVSTLDTSPTLVNDYAKEFTDDKIEVDAVTFDIIDDGTIDLLLVDTEGCEWYVIDKMKSRPAVISLETHGGMYINPNMDKISDWMLHNGYERYFLTGSDTIFTRMDMIDISVKDKILLSINDIVISFRRNRKKFKKFIRAASK